ncbi:15216_t:CDS:2, partial [Entrophospora sp. SA101]
MFKKHTNTYNWLVEDFQEFYNYKNCQSYYSEKIHSTGPLYSEDGKLLKDDHEYIWRLKLLPRLVDGYVSLFVWPIQSDCEKEFKPCQGIPELCKIHQIFPDKDFKKKTNLLIRVQFAFPDQINLKTFNYDLEEYLNNEKFSDIRFKFSCGNELKASRIVLSIKSEYYKKKFDRIKGEKECCGGEDVGGWGELNSNEVIKMDDNVSYECFKEILYFFYTNRLQENLLFEILRDLYLQANIINLEELKDLATTKIIKMIDENNWSEILMLGWSTNNLQLKNIAFKYINKNCLSNQEPNIKEPYISEDTVYIEGKTYSTDNFTNVTPTILSKITRKLHLQQQNRQTSNYHHPISILANKIKTHFNDFDYFDSFNPVVTTKENFDDLGFPIDHPGRSTTDSYYINKNVMLRTHTSAHQLQAFKLGYEKFLISADVYRRDEIDSNHYPVFHQMEGARIFPIDKVIAQVNNELMLNSSFSSSSKNKSKSGNDGDGDDKVKTNDDTIVGSSNPLQSCHPIEEANATIKHLKYSLNSMVRWIDAYFPFTSPSWEMEIFYNGKWLEICGCQSNKIGWAFGLGLERIAMVLFGIPDIRLFWSKDERFTSQFTSSDKIVKFQPFSKHPSCTKDISFWLNNEEDGREMKFHENNFCEIVRAIAADLVEDVKL